MLNLILNSFQFGSIEPPPGIESYGTETAGLIILLNNILKIIIYVSGLVALINFLVSGIQLIGSSGNPETIKTATNRIWFSLLGLVVVAGSIAVAAVVGLIFFGNATAIIIPVIPGG